MSIASSSFGTAMAFMYLCSSVAYAQWKGDFDRSEEAIAKGQDLVLQFSQGAYHLPNRWAGVVVYASETTPDDKEFRLTNGYSYHAEDKKLGLKVSSAKFVSKQPQINGEGGIGGFPREWNAWRSKHEYLVTEFSQWKTYEESRKRRQFFIHPYCAPLINPTDLERDIPETLFEQAFFATILSSLGIREEKDYTISLWGPKEATQGPTGSKLLRFDNESKRPTEMVFAFHPKWDPIKFNSMPSQVTDRISIKWKKFDVGEMNEEESKNKKAKEQKQEAEQWLPVEVACNITTVEGMSEELASKVFWKFGGDVPDSAFNDPRKHPFQLIPFEGADIAKIDKEALGQ